MANFKTNKLNPAGAMSVVQAGVSFEVGAQLSATTSWQSYTTDDEAIQTRFKCDNDFIISHVNDDATKVFSIDDVILEGAGMTVYYKALSSVTISVLINKGRGNV